MTRFTVAIDGPAASGKGTISRAVAETFGFAHLDTGLLYRAVGKKALTFTDGPLDPDLAGNLAAHLTEADLAADDLRTAPVAQAASRVAAIPQVRAALLDFQKRFARREGGAVLDGRDIGTVICPDAEVKLFVTANDRTRAERRFAELTANGHETDLDTVLADLRARDKRDASRDAAPLKPAPDAHLLDTTELSIDAAVAEAVTKIKKRIGQGRD
ncbi:(d)CMP kinase [Oceanomicrobium pacificus]|uniref:Cytidylate kinase n=1 Tax=Oceanomicrobium pacificus TaxID=2692916 RepID=A0A6B0TRK1_9RHOB|nr:(d)CMP kinase [Oceanomicrobium pacificus]MXU64435.1 (d)CMP kinase [Oceanomicrobium pacificus]